MLPSNNIKTSLIAPCGMNCGLCLGYIGEKNKCPGCFRIDQIENIPRVKCRIKNCEELKKADSKYCFACNKYPCARLKQLDKRYKTKYSMSMIDNLDYIKQFGIRNFINQEKKKWVCPGCGTILCVHRESCISCGYKWH